MTRATTAADRHEYIGITEAALRFGLSRDTLARAARDGNLESRRTGKLWLTTPAAIDAYLKSARHRRGPKPQRRALDALPASGTAGTA